MTRIADTRDTVSLVLQGVDPAVRAGRRSMRDLLRLYFNQADVVFKGRRSQGQEMARFAPPHDATVVDLRSACGSKITALFGRAISADPAAAPTILYFYGNDLWLQKSLEVFQLLRTLGVNVLMPEYVGYGLSEGKPSERACYATADAAYEHLLSRRQIDAAKIVAMGASLGGAVAIDLASRRSVAGLITLITFSSMRELVRHLLPHLPVHWLLRYRFDSLTKIRRVACPTLIAHSHGDDLIPRCMADRLAAAAGGPVTRVDLEKASHRQFELLQAVETELFPAVRTFLRDACGIAAAGANHR
jgi:pimeloyl-ACP methyl ester carboxylesterase